MDQPIRLNFFQKLANSFAALAMIPFITGIGFIPFVDFKNKNGEHFFMIFEEVSFCCVIAAIVLRTIIWHVRDVKGRKTGRPFANNSWRYNGIVLARYGVATIMLMYGWCKLIGHQIEMSTFWYDDLVGEADGFELAWTFFGFSKIYLFFIAGTEILTGVLLFYRRTTLLSSAILFGLLLNICIMDFTHDINAKEIIVPLLLVVIYLLSLGLPQITATFWTHKGLPPQNIQPAYNLGGKFHMMLKSCAIACCLLLAIYSSYAIGKQYDTTKLQGVWRASKVYTVGDTLIPRYYTDTVKFNFYIEGYTAELARGDKQNYMKLTLDSTKGQDFSMVTKRDKLGIATFKGHYQFISKDSLLLMGRQGADSVQYVLKRMR